MIKTIKDIIATLAMSLLVAAPMAGLATVSVHAQGCLDNSASATINNCLNNGACLSTTDTTCGGDAQSSVDKIIKLIINIFSLIVGVVSVIMIIVGGLKYITSGGDSGNVTGAKNTILYAIIGLVVVALAQIVVKFVLAKVPASA